MQLVLCRMAGKHPLLLLPALPGTCMARLCCTTATPSPPQPCLRTSQASSSAGLLPANAAPPLLLLAHVVDVAAMPLLLLLLLHSAARPPTSRRHTPTPCARRREVLLHASRCWPAANISSKQPGPGDALPTQQGPLGAAARAVAHSEDAGGMM